MRPWRWASGFLLLPDESTSMYKGVSGCHCSQKWLDTLCFSEAKRVAGMGVMIVSVVMGQTAWGARSKSDM